MKAFITNILLSLCIGYFFSTTVIAAEIRPHGWNEIKHVVVIVLENGSPIEALRHPYLHKLTQKGAFLSSYYAVTHPSQPNYIAMIAGNTFGKLTDNNVTIDQPHLGDLLERAGKTWKTYAENYPGNCFLDKKSPDRLYVRKHVPFLSFANIQNNSQRCKNIVEAQEFTKDLSEEKLPNFSFYIPNLDNDGHDTSVEFAGNWVKSFFDPIFADEKNLQDILFIITFDEDDKLNFNKVYTVFLGAGIMPGSRSTLHYTHYSLLKTIEGIFSLGDLSQHDATAKTILGIWK